MQHFLHLFSLHSIKYLLKMNAEYREWIECLPGFQYCDEKMYCCYSSVGRKLPRNIPTTQNWIARCLSCSRYIVISIHSGVCKGIGWALLCIPNYPNSRDDESACGFSLLTIVPSIFRGIIQHSLCQVRCQRSYIRQLTLPKSFCLLLDVHVFPLCFHEPSSRLGLLVNKAFALEENSLSCLITAKMLFFNKLLLICSLMACTITGRANISSPIGHYNASGVAGYSNFSGAAVSVNSSTKGIQPELNLPPRFPANFSTDRSQWPHSTPLLGGSSGAYSSPHLARRQFNDSTNSSSYHYWSGWRNVKYLFTLWVGKDHPNKAWLTIDPVGILIPVPISLSLVAYLTQRIPLAIRPILALHPLMVQITSISWQLHTTRALFRRSIWLMVEPRSMMRLYPLIMVHQYKVFVNRCSTSFMTII